MRNTLLKGTILAGLSLALVANVAQAQKPGVELGVTLASFAAMNPDGSGNNLTLFTLGSASTGGVALSTGQGVTAAWYLNEQIAIEPTLGYGHAKAEGASDATSILSLGVGVPIYLKKGWGKAGGIFIEPFVGTNKVSSGGTSTTQNHWGANVGTKMMVGGMSNLFWRAQASWDNGMENTSDGIPKITTIGASFGLSLYLH